MSPDKRSTPPDEKNISISGDVKDSVVIAGDSNTVNQTIIQKFFNIFKSDSETFEQRNRRILLNHVENAWIKGVLDASLHGAALLDLGIKEDPEAVTKYPWAIKKEATDETLPAVTSMLEIFDSIGVGRSLLILGAPGSGKTTMLLELARQLIERARTDVTEPIPMVFNLASWTEKFTLADWLAQELNNLYSIPRKTAPDWVKGDKLLLLLDGLDEVRQDSRAKCVEAINAFRKEHGLTSLAVCSRSQDYADINTRLSFEGAIEVQPLTQKQITEFFTRFGKEMTSIKQVLKKDSVLREMAETPLFLSIMVMAYRDKRDVEILFLGDEKARRKHLFDTYIERMFERPRAKNEKFRKRDVLHWLSWMAHTMNKEHITSYYLKNMQTHWLSRNMYSVYMLIVGSTFGLIISLCMHLIIGLYLGMVLGLWSDLGNFLLLGLMYGLLVGVVLGVYGLLRKRIEPRIGHRTIRIGEIESSVVIVGQKLLSIEVKMDHTLKSPWKKGVTGLFIGLIGGIIIGLIYGLGTGLVVGLFISFILGLDLFLDVIKHYTLRFILARNNLLPWRLVPFLDHCVDLIFLRGVGGGYIFVHRLLMEHFAEMYTEEQQEAIQPRGA